MKILHLSFHKGCQNDIEYICNKLGLNVEYKTFTDGITKDNEIYNITHQRALDAWNNYKDYYRQFDLIITSDTCPISRVFLQNNWDKKLIIWICNRFDYSHGSNSGFPDKEYYNLINDVKNRPNVKIIGYTPFENYYANNIRNLNIGNNVIKPIGKISSIYSNYKSTIIDDKQDTFFVGSYHNDNIMMNLKEKILELGINVYNGRYNGPLDLAEFKGVIHIPYAWSNLALFEAIQLGITYFIPSINFLKELKIGKSFFWSPPYKEELLYLSEWYCDNHKDIIIYFDSWNDLVNKTNNFDYNSHKEKLIKFGEQHENNMLELWREIL